MEVVKSALVFPIRRRKRRTARIAKDVIRDRGLGKGALRVYCELALWAGADGVVKRGQRSIATWLGVHQETVVRALRELEGRGHIRVESKGRERGRYVLLGIVRRKRDLPQTVVAQAVAESLAG